MTVPPASPSTARPRIFGKARLIVILTLLALLILCLAFSWTTRDAMANLPFLKGQARGAKSSSSKKTLVDLRPWQTAVALTALAVSAEEHDYARDAERLADHEVDQAFATALRSAAFQAQHRTLTGEALALSHKVAQFQQLVDQDQALMQRLAPSSNSAAGSLKNAAKPTADDADVDIAKAQLGLDSDELADAQNDLDRASGDNRAQIQSELTAHQAAQTKYDAESHSTAQVAVLAVAQHGTLAGRINAWKKQIDRYKLIQQALDQTQADIADLTSEHNALEANANASNAAATSGASGASDRNSRLASIRSRSAERQLLGIYDDRIQTEQQLATVYGKWSAQVLLQHRIVLHLILQSTALIVFIVICMLLSDALVRRFLARPSLDRRQMQTLRTILEVGVQALGIVCILLVVFGSPQQTSTILGLATAGITIVLQDFILAFFGWFVLMGKHGIRVGDWVEINGVGGEVTEIGLIYTTLLETGTLKDKGNPTGRSITLINGYAIRGQYFNFSTSGQWMWDEITVSIPLSANTQDTVNRIQTAVLDETKDNSQAAEGEWKRATHGQTFSEFNATPVVNLTPSGSGVDVRVRYVTRAPSRVEVRNRVYQRVIDLLHEKDLAAQTPPPPVNPTEERSGGQK
jgi:small-conductance mechanosensitive channel